MAALPAFVAKMTHKVIRYVLLTVGVGLVLSAVVVVISVAETRASARILLNDVRDLNSASDPTAVFRSLQRKYGSRLKSVGCERTFCIYELRLSNRGIAWLQIVPYVEIKADFFLMKESIHLATVEYRVALKGPHSPVLNVQVGMCAPGCGVRFDVNPHGSPSDMWNGLVVFDTRATRNQQDAALALNLNCLSQIGGCKDISELLPSMWRRDGTSLTPKLVGLSQRLEESHAPPGPDDF